MSLFIGGSKDGQWMETDRHREFVEFLVCNNPETLIYPRSIKEYEENRDDPKFDGSMTRYSAERYLNTRIHLKGYSFNVFVLEGMDMEIAKGRIIEVMIMDKIKKVEDHYKTTTEWSETTKE